MLAVLVIVLPIFALILAGWGARRLGVLGPHATGELNRFVVWLALPALLFDIVAGADWSSLWRPGFAAAFGLGAAVVFVLPLLWAAWRRRPLADAAIDALNVAYPNTGFVGFPLATAAFGAAALAPTLIATILTVCWVFAAALVLIEIGLRSPDKSGGAATANVARSLITNPLLVAPALGLVVMALGVTMPEPVERFLKLLGAAASPCALVALGLFLGEKQAGSKPANSAVAAMVALKLIAQPAVTWLLAAQVFHLEPMLTHVCVLMAALPTGTGPFMLAEFYKREAGPRG
jgi:predicted permease